MYRDLSSPLFCLWKQGHWGRKLSPRRTDDVVFCSSSQPWMQMKGPTGRSHTKYWWVLRETSSSTTPQDSSPLPRGWRWPWGAPMPSGSRPQIMRLLRKESKAACSHCGFSELPVNHALYTEEVQQMFFLFFFFLYTSKLDQKILGARF